jgi:uncharacterized protein YbjT (DUF2867 family)
MDTLSQGEPLSRILLTGATGYVGGRLLTALEAAGYHVRCLARRPEALQHRAGPLLEVVAGDVQDPPSLGPALAGCEVAYYLVHSMGAGSGFGEADRQAATSFGRAARLAGVRQIIYLGGLGSGNALSPHLASRQEVGRLLAASGVPTIEFRASIVIGSGSLSFEMIRALVERLPVMVAPRWVRTPTQPIAVEDLIAYLLASGRRVLSFSLCHSPRWRHLSRFISSARGTYFSKMASSLLESWLN